MVPEVLPDPLQVEKGSRDLLYPCCFATSGENAVAQSCQITYHGAIALEERVAVPELPELVKLPLLV
jgi:hypothetical protein